MSKRKSKEQLIDECNKWLVIMRINDPESKEYSNAWKKLYERICKLKPEVRSSLVRQKEGIIS